MKKDNITQTKASVLANNLLTYYSTKITPFLPSEGENLKEAYQSISNDPVYRMRLTSLATIIEDNLEEIELAIYKSGKEYVDNPAIKIGVTAKIILSDLKKGNMSSYSIIKELGLHLSCLNDFLKPE